MIRNGSQAGSVLSLIIVVHTLTKEPFTCIDAVPCWGEIQLSGRMHRQNVHTGANHAAALPHPVEQADQCSLHSNSASLLWTFSSNLTKTWSNGDHHVQKLASNPVVCLSSLLSMITHVTKSSTHCLKHPGKK